MIIDTSTDCWDGRDLAIQAVMSPVWDDKVSDSSSDS